MALFSHNDGKAAGQLLVLKLCSSKAEAGRAYLRAPPAYERDVIEQGSPGDLLQGLDHIINVHMTHQHPQTEAPLKLLDPVVDIVWLQQVESVWERSVCQGCRSL